MNSFKNINPLDIWQSFVDWCVGYLFQENTLYQGYIIVMAFLFGFVLYQMANKPLKKKIEEMDLPTRIRRLVDNFRRLLFPFLTLMIMFLMGVTAQSAFFGVEILLVEGVMKVIAAWIIIRIMVQFIDNVPIRNFVAFTIMIIAALSIFGSLDYATQTLDAVGFSLGETRLSLLVVIKTALYLFFLLYGAILFSSFAERKVLQTKGMTRSSQVLLAKIIRVVLVGVALIIGINSSGIDLSLFAVFGGAVGLGLGFGLQKGISNLFSGMLLLMDRSIKPGDVIEIPDIGTFGWVNHMAARYTEIVTRDNKSFLIPNEDFITQRVINWSHGNSLVRIHLQFGVHYDSDPHNVMKIACEAATKPERVVDSPKPVCWITAFGDSSIDFDLRFWIKDAEKGVANIRGEVYLAIWDAFKEHNIQIPYPHREVFIHQNQ
ncbi:MAG: mechanosensitive ion channel [Alphaproteobacteria bacterium]|nr:mechanosensitive ion channel [Alphaproteobacteria bacterium]